MATVTPTSTRSLEASGGGALPGLVLSYDVAWFWRPLSRRKSLIPFPSSGVAHSDDLIYLFPDGELNEEEASVARTMVELWTNFATYGSVS